MAKPTFGSSRKPQGPWVTLGNPKLHEARKKYVGARYTQSVANILERA